MFIQFHMAIELILTLDFFQDQQSLNANSAKMENTSTRLTG